MIVLKWMTGIVLISAAVLVVQSLPDIARYLKMRNM